MKCECVRKGVCVYVQTPVLGISKWSVSEGVRMGSRVGACIKKYMRMGMKNGKVFVRASVTYGSE